MRTEGGSYKLLKAWAEIPVREATWTELFQLGQKVRAVDHPPQLDRMLKFLERKKMIRRVKTNTSRVRYVRSSDFEQAEHMSENAREAMEGVKQGTEYIRSSYADLEPSDRTNAVLLLMFQIGVLAASDIYYLASANQKWREYASVISSEYVAKLIEQVRLLNTLDPRATQAAMVKWEKILKELVSTSANQEELEKFLLRFYSSKS